MNEQVCLRQVNPSGSRVFMGTLSGGIDVHTALAQAARMHHIQTATLELLGGLREIEFRAFDFESQQRRDPLLLVRPMEIVAGHGTLSLLNDEPHLHFHIAVAFSDPAVEHGVSVVAGHAVRMLAHAVEFTLTAYDGAPVHRALHPPTGLQLWDLPPLDLP